MNKIEFKAMGCHMSVTLDSSSLHNKERLGRVPGWFEAWEQSLSRFRPDSELSRVNQQAGEAIHVSQEFLDVLQIALEVENRSHGLVTPRVLDALVLAGYDRSFDELSKDTVSRIPKNNGGQAVLDPIEWSNDPRTIRLPSHMHLDFGGVAKGWAAHQAMLRLKSYGPVLIDAGGDIAISGLQSDRQPWPVAIADPFKPDTDLETLHLGRCGVATSGTDYRRWKQDGEWRHHIIDPRTGKPAQTDVISATIVASNVMDAEMAAKITLISGSQSGMAWLEGNPAFAGLLVLENGTRLYSQRMANYLWRTS
jgi:thiamine biosynthesis lipoprotein